MKICTTCKVEKEKIEFNKNKSRKDGLNNICRSCSNLRSRKYYTENTDHHRRVVSKRKKIVRENNQEKFLSFIKEQKCTDCGTTDYRVFEFDHINDDKFANVSLLLNTGYSWNIIQEEMNKCEIVCANCHRIRTFTRQRNYRIAP